MVLTVARTGHTPVEREFDTTVPDELAELEKQFQQNRDEGMLAVATRPDGSKVQVNDLDQEAEEIVFHSPLVGG